MTETKLSASHVLADLEALLDPHVEILSLSWQPQAGIVSVEATVKPTGLTADALPPDMRAALFESAQTAIKIVERAGYQHDEPPTINIGGDTAEIGGTVFIQTSGTVRFELRPPEVPA